MRKIYSLFPTDCSLAAIGWALRFCSKVKRVVEYPEHELEMELNRPTVERDRCCMLALFDHINSWLELLIFDSEYEFVKNLHYEIIGVPFWSYNEYRNRVVDEVLLILQVLV